MTFAVAVALAAASISLAHICSSLFAAMRNFLAANAAFFAAVLAAAASLC